VRRKCSAGKEMQNILCTFSDLSCSCTDRSSYEHQPAPLRRRHNCAHFVRRTRTSQPEKAYFQKKNMRQQQKTADGTFTCVAIRHLMHTPGGTFSLLGVPLLPDFEGKSGASL
jgi:hypothetical protein